MLKIIFINKEILSVYNFKIHSKKQLFKFIDSLYFFDRFNKTNNKITNIPTIINFFGSSH